LRSSIGEIFDLVLKPVLDIEDQARLTVLKSPLEANPISEISDEEFETKVLKTSELIIVEFLNTRYRAPSSKCHFVKIKKPLKEAFLWSGSSCKLFMGGAANSNLFYLNLVKKI
jgi:hypothetical protein